ncbi:MAG: adenosylhomocysteinase [Methylocella sp.]
MPAKVDHPSRADGIVRRQLALDEVTALLLDKIGFKLSKLTPEQSIYLGLPELGPFKLDHHRY